MPSKTTHGGRREKPDRLTPSAAKELGRALRMFRTTQQAVVHEVARAAGMSLPYLSNIELGQKVTVADDYYARLAKVLRLPPDTMPNLLTRALVKSALEWRGLSPEQIAFVWMGIEQRALEQGVDLRIDIANVVEYIFTQSHLFEPRRRANAAEHSDG